MRFIKKPHRLLRSVAFFSFIVMLSSFLLPVRPIVAQICSEAYLKNRQVSILNCTGDETCGEQGAGGPISGDNNAIIAYNILVSELQLSAAQASGIIGNLMNESGGNDYNLNPAVVGEGMCAGGSDCRGIAQWSQSRFSSLETWARGQGLDPLTIEAQARYIVEELQNVPGHWSVTLGNLQAIGGHTPEAARAAAAEFNATFEVGINTPQRQANAARFFTEYAQSATPPPPGSVGGGGGAGANCEVPVVEGLECPAAMRPHPTVADYFLMPDAPNGEYVANRAENRRWGSRELVCALHTVGMNYFREMNGTSRLIIGNLNTPYGRPSVSHRWGTANDQWADGDVQAATTVMGRYDEDATITLGRMWVQTGILQDIWWCPPDASSEPQANGRTQVEIRNLASGAGQTVDIHCIDGHRDHFHVNILDAHRNAEFDPGG